MSKKYSLTQNTKQFNGITLYQIKAEKDFSDVKKGDLGGWIEKEANLSQEGNCWVYGNAWVYDDARLESKASFTLGRFIGGDDSGKITEITDKTGSTFWKKQYVLGDYKIEPIEEENSQKTELLKKAQELIDKAQELKEEANKL